MFLPFMGPAHRSPASEISPFCWYDVLILDAAYKQSLTCARSLGRAGLRVAVGERRVESNLPERVPAFKSRYCARSLHLPDYVGSSRLTGIGLPVSYRACPLSVSGA